MQNKGAISKDWISTAYKSFTDNQDNNKKELNEFRSTNYNLLTGLKFPTRRDEDWKYTNFNKAFNKSYVIGEKTDACTNWKEYSFEDLEAYRMVFINGHYSADHSTIDSLENGISIEPLHEALKNNETSQWVNSIISEQGGAETNAFAPFNSAFADNGYFVSVNNNIIVSKPICIIFLTDVQGQEHISHPQLFVKTGKGSEVTIIESYHAIDNSMVYFTNTCNWVDVGDNAKVDHYRLQFESRAAYQVNNTLATQGSNSVYSNYAVDFGGLMIRNNLSAILKGSGTMTNYYGAYLGSESQHIDNQTFIDHAMPHCESNELYKGVLKDHAKGIFNGKVLVRQDAQKTNAFQQNSSLVLSDTATMNAKPQLEIYADDVKCSHGATIGQLDEESVFYLESRGIPREQAKNLLQKAFVGEVINHFPLSEIKDKILERVDLKLFG